MNRQAGDATRRDDWAEVGRRFEPHEAFVRARRGEGVEVTTPQHHHPVVGWPTWLGLVCDDLEAQRAWYGEVLGLRETGAGQDWVQFDLAGHTFELLRVDRSRPQYDARRFQVGFEVAEIHSAREALTRGGARAISKVEGGLESGGYWAYFRDPEGNVFEVKQDLDGQGSEPSGGPV
jgi:catechol 2,3-dioxygenase-like lactoylglutathione lyase family enzyme